MVLPVPSRMVQSRREWFAPSRLGLGADRRREWFGAVVANGSDRRPSSRMVQTIVANGSEPSRMVQTVTNSYRRL